MLVDQRHCSPGSCLQAINPGKKPWEVGVEGAVMKFLAELACCPRSTASTSNDQISIYKQIL
jgi:hypothetical protein